ncbi:MAG: HD domain-containing phosphohydrolase [Cyanobacteriota bacterium]|nr:HD domain-containing phosphohydrolase [Cyanobacteriota bacterium]
MTIGLNLPEILQDAPEKTALIEQLLDIGVALSDTNDLGQLLNLILSKSLEITLSDAGSLYLVDSRDERGKLLFKAAQNASLPMLSFNEFAMPITPQSLAGYVAITGESLNLPDAYNLPDSVPYRLAKGFDLDIGYRTCSVLVLPMQNRQREVIGVIQLINRKVKAGVKITGENAKELTQPYSEWEERIVRSLASQAAISIERNQLQENIENLFEGFVKASVQAIEARDICTSGHSERVAELTVRLAREANLVERGSLAFVRFDNCQIKEIRYAALLHDFGKIGVPEAILNKGKKLYKEQLETIRQRFAVARRTLELESARAKYDYLLKNSSYPHQHEKQKECPYCQLIENEESILREKTSQLDAYWEVLLKANEPNILAEEPLQQLRELSQYAYEDIDGSLKPLVTAEEIMQLTVPRGNLTPEERLAMEAHVTYSYEFLKRIPWTNKLKQIPEIAYGHHEKLDGSGYPRGLKQEKIPVQTQMMVIADIYDALTAGDRPYKRGLPTENALRILREEAARNKINGELLELFQQREVFAVLGHSLESGKE